MRVSNLKSQIANRKSLLGFTLVEMLVVIAIIGILAALLVPALGAAIRRSKIGAISLEMNNLSNAFEAYKSKYTEYPPDFSDRAAVQAHIRKAFPRNTLNLNPNLTDTTSWYFTYPWLGSVPSGTVDPKTLDPAEALVFWLRAIKNNPRNPLDIDNVHPNTAYVVDGVGDPVPFFEFDETRLIDIDKDGWPEYASAHSRETPYVYFDGRIMGGTYQYATAVYPPSGSDTGFGVTRPYRSNTAIDSRDNGRTVPSASPNTTQWMDAAKFQILCAGLDNNFGPDLFASGGLLKQFPDPNYQLSDEDMDNLASFSDGDTIGDSQP